MLFLLLIIDFCRVSIFLTFQWSLYMDYQIQSLCIIRYMCEPCICTAVTEIPLHPCASICTNIILLWAYMVYVLLFWIFYCCICGTTLLLQLSGRAGRNGNPSMCLLFSNRTETKSCKDEKLISFTTSTKTCRRRILLKSLGSDEHIHTNSKLRCDICTHNHFPYSRFEFLHPHKIQWKPKPQDIRSVEKDVLDSLKNALLVERQLLKKALVYEQLV